MAEPMADVAAYYDDYTDRQVAVGVNARHRAIATGMRAAGWRPEHRVFEIGAGVGTLTQLIAEGLGPDGSLLAVDLSPKSIEIARERLASHTT